MNCRRRRQAKYCESCFRGNNITAGFWRGTPRLFLEKGDHDGEFAAINRRIDGEKGARCAGRRRGENRQAARERLLTARERIDLLVDAETFIEFGQLNTSDQPGLEETTYGDGLVAGIGKVNGRSAVIIAGDKTVLAGTEGSVHLRKSRQMHALAVRNGLPMFFLHEGGGLRMPDGMGSDGISDKLFPRELLTHHRQVPTMAAILGDSYGGPTWTAVSCDFVTQLKGTCMAIAGPRMLELANGQRIAPDELGGVDIHHQYTGQIDADGETEAECIEQLKRFFSYMPQNANERPPMRKTNDDPYRMVEEVFSILPDRRSRVYDMRRIIACLVDDGDYFEYQKQFGKALITALAHLNGHVVGIIANQPSQYAGAPGPQECQKATEFICLCDSYHIPLIFLHDTPGFRISVEAEKAKMATKIMVWNQALALSTVPKISVVIRKSIGAAYGNMCGPGMGRMLLSPGRARKSISPVRKSASTSYTAASLNAPTTRMSGVRSCSSSGRLTARRTGRRANI
ncbi:Methylmalonyl-CoA carboxyltransferase 12S subunit [Geobacillus sp. BCO2]|nr:Methylmalonyl-CoA carboxyltransferase 12S subunit [Geobacillus sp. BCO2]